MDDTATQSGSSSAPTWDQLQQLVNPPALPTASDQSSDSSDQGASVNASGAPNVDASVVNSIISGQPAIEQPDLSDEPLTDAQKKAVIADESAATAEEKQAYQKYLTDLDVSTADTDKLTQREIDTLSAPPPAPPQPDANPLQRMAPLLIMAALGGKLTKQDARLMLASTNGIVQGYLQGDATKLSNSQKQYEEAYQQFKDRQAQQLKIYDTLKEAYQGRPDADLKALALSHQMTGDDLKVDQDRLTAQEHFEAAAKKVADVDNAMNEKRWMDRGNFAIRKKNSDIAAAKAKAAAAGSGAPPMTDDEMRTAAQYAIKGGKDPTFGMGKNADRDRYNKIRAQEIQKAGGAGGAIGQGITTKAQTTQANVVARREGGVSAALAALNESNGLFDQYLATARKLDFGSNEVKNQLKLAAAGRVVSNPDVQAYVSLNHEVQQEMTQIGSRGGQATDTVRKLVADQFPLNASYDTTKRAVDVARGVAISINNGNTTVADAIAKGIPLEQALKLSPTSGKTGAVSSSTLSQYAKQHKISVDASRKFLSSQGYTVQ